MYTKNIYTYVRTRCTEMECKQKEMTKLAQHYGQIFTSYRYIYIISVHHVYSIHTAVHKYRVYTKHRNVTSVTGIATRSNNNNNDDNNNNFTNYNNI